MMLMHLRKITRFFYRYRGLARIADYIRKLYCKYDKKILIQDFDQNLKFNCYLNEHMGSQIFWRGFYSEEQLKLLDLLLKDDMVFIDVGANQGEFTVFAAKRLTNGLVISFEPISLLFERLKQNIEANNFKNVIFFQKGLSDVEQNCSIYTSHEKFKDGTDHQGLYTMFLRGNMSEYQETINLISLDNFVIQKNIKKVDLIKIDIEGAELYALEGAKETINTFQPIIILEVNQQTCQAAGYDPKDLLYFLGELGYSFEVIMRNGTTKTISEMDLVEFQNIVCYTQDKAKCFN